jgi:hypothetical protein
MLTHLSCFCATPTQHLVQLGITWSPPFLVSDSRSYNFSVKSDLIGRSGHVSRQKAPYQVQDHAIRLIDRNPQSSKVY